MRAEGDEIERACYEDPSQPWWSSPESPLHARSVAMALWAVQFKDIIRLFHLPAIGIEVRPTGPWLQGRAIRFASESKPCRFPRLRRIGVPAPAEARLRN